MVRLLPLRPRAEDDRQMARPLADSRRAPERSRPVPLERRALVDVGLADEELLGEELVVVLGVCGAGVQELQDIVRGVARCVRQHRAGIGDGLPANVVDYESRLARCAAHELGARADGYE